MPLYFFSFKFSFSSFHFQVCKIFALLNDFAVFFVFLMFFSPQQRGGVACRNFSNLGSNPDNNFIWRDLRCRRGVPTIIGRISDFCSSGCVGNFLTWICLFFLNREKGTSQVKPEEYFFSNFLRGRPWARAYATLREIAAQEPDDSGRHGCFTMNSSYEH